MKNIRKLMQHLKVKLIDLLPKPKKLHQWDFINCHKLPQVLTYPKGLKNMKFRK